MVQFARDEDLLPAPASAWDREAAAHLLRRAGFGGPPQEIERAHAAGLDAAVSELIGAPADEPELEAAIRDAGGVLGDAEHDDDRAVAALRSWWLFRMIHTRHPLREKMALFWHDHFATQARGAAIRASALRAQNELFRRAGLGSFRELCEGVARDPAMLVFLDNRLSRKERPSENWARELCELFTLGVDQYSQEDVREIARAFTGWSTPEHPDRFEFHARDHDTGDKLVLGRRLRGRFGDRGLEEGREVLDLLVQEPASRAFLARKLLSWFVCDEPTGGHVAALAKVLERTGGELAPALGVLFRSRLFYAPEQRWAQYRSPVDIVAGTLRALEVQNGHLLPLGSFLRRMGMCPFEPPSVAGWSGGEEWIATGALLGRAHFAAHVAAIAHSTRPLAATPAADFDALARSAGPGAGPRAELRAMAQRLLGRPLDARRETFVARRLAERIPGDSAAARRERARAAVHLLLRAPEASLA